MPDPVHVPPKPKPDTMMVFTGIKKMFITTRKTNMNVTTRQAALNVKRGN